MVKLKTLSEGALSVATISSIGLMSNTNIAHASTSSNLATKENVPYNDTKDILTKDDYHTNTVHFVYNGKTLATKKYSGYLNQKFDVKKDVPQGYQVKDSHLPTKFGFADQEYSVNLAKSVVPDKQTQSKLARIKHSYVQNNWDNLEAQGYHKTGAGWTRTPAQGNYNAIATKSSVELLEQDGSEWSTDKTVHIRDMTRVEGINLSVTMNKNDVKKGNTILVASIPQLTSDKNRWLEWTDDQNQRDRNVFDKLTGQKIGTIRTVNKNGEWDYFVDITTDIKYAKDVEFSYNINHSRQYDYNSWGGYQNLKGTTQDNPFIEKFVTPQGKTYTTTYITTPEDNLRWYGNSGIGNLDVQRFYDNSPLQIDVPWSKVNINIAGIGWQNRINPDNDANNYNMRGVFKLKSSTQRITKIGNIHNENYDTMFLSNGNHVDRVRYDSYTHWNNAGDNDNSQRLADNLTNNELYDKTPEGGSCYSMQSDGSVLVSYKFHLSDFKMNKDSIVHQLIRSYYWNLQQESDKEKILNDTIKAYEKRNFMPNTLDISFHYWIDENDASKNSIISVTDVTPNDAHRTGDVKEYHPNGQSSSTAVYRPVELRFVDDDDAQRLIGSDSVIGVSGENLEFDVTAPAKYVLNQNGHINYGIVNLDNNRSVTIHVKHKIIGTAGGFTQNADKDLMDYIHEQERKNSNVHVTYENSKTYFGDIDNNDSMQRAFNDANNDLISQLSNAKKVIESGGTEIKIHTVSVKQNGRSHYTVITEQPQNKYGSNQQILHFDPVLNRNVAMDMVTGQTRHAGHWRYANHQSSNKVQIPQIVGYKAWYDSNNSDQIDLLDPNSQIGMSVSTDGNGSMNNIEVTTNYEDRNRNLETKNIYINYTPLKQNSTVILHDDTANKDLSSFGISGLTDHGVAVSEKIRNAIPQWFDLADGQTIPAEYRFDNQLINGQWHTHTEPMVIHLKHHIEDVTDQDPKAHNGRSYTFNYHYPKDFFGEDILQDSSKTYSGSVVRTALKDMVTNVTTYGEWRYNGGDIDLTSHTLKHLDIHPGMIANYDPEIVGFNDRFIEGNVHPYDDDQDPFYDSQFKFANNLGDYDGNIDNAMASHTFDVTYKSQRLQVIYQIVDSTNDNVLDTVSKSGYIGDVVNPELKVPKNYELDDNSSIPGDYTFENTERDDGSPIVDTIVMYVHPKIITIDKGDGTTKEIVRTITIKTDGQKDNVIRQVAALHRTGQKNLVTGEINWGQWSQGKWETYNVPQVEGELATIVSDTGGNEADDPDYDDNSGDDSESWFDSETDKELADDSQESVKEIAEQVVDSDTANRDIVIKYMKNNHRITEKVIYIDKNTNEQVGEDSVTGHQDETVKLEPDLPFAYKLVDGGDTVNVKLVKDGNIVKVYVEGGDVIIKHDHPRKDGEDIPGYDKYGRDQNTTFPANLSYDDLNRTIKRTINVNIPNSEGQTIVQTVKLHRDAKIDMTTGNVYYTDWVADGDRDWEEYIAPTVSGYIPQISKVNKVAPSPDAPDQTITINYTNGKNALTVVYVDDTKTMREMARYYFDGLPGQSIDLSSLTVPEHYHVVNGDLPASYIMKDSFKNVLTIHFTENYKDVSDTDPKATHTVVRKIVVVKPDGSRVTSTQTVVFHRTATLDTSDNQTAYGPWQVVEVNGRKITPKEQDTFTLSGINIEPIDGYHVSVNGDTRANIVYDTNNQARINPLTVNAMSNSTNVEVTYVANAHKGTYEFVDATDGKIIGPYSYAGDSYGETYVHIDLPDGYKLADGVVLPTKIDFENHDNTPIQIKVVHGIQDAATTAPDAKRVIKRIIIIENPKTYENKYVTQEVTFTRPAKYDMVTHEYAYGAWDKEVKTFDSFTPPEIKGYTANIIAKEAVSPDDTDETVFVDYKMGQRQLSVSYVDDEANGKEVTKTVVSGQANSEVKTNLTVPEGYQVAHNSSLPKTHTFGSQDESIVIHLVHKKDNIIENKDVRRTIHYVDENGQQLMPDKMQTVRISRSNTRDEVTGKVTNNDWNTSSGEFAKVESPIVEGFTPDMAEIKAEKVNPNEPMKEITVTYHKAKGRSNSKHVQSFVAIPHKAVQIIDSKLQVVNHKINTSAINNANHANVKPVKFAQFHEDIVVNNMPNKVKVAEFTMDEEPVTPPLKEEDTVTFEESKPNKSKPLIKKSQLAKVATFSNKKKSTKKWETTKRGTQILKAQAVNIKKNKALTGVLKVTKV